MAVLSSECCDHYDYDDGEMNTYDDSKPRWMDSLRTRTPSTGKPGWKGSVKANSPSMRTYSEGGSLRTQRTRPRSKSAKRSTHGRSKSPGLFGSTFASRAKQREAIGTPLARSRANSVSSMPPDSARSRTRSLSPRRLRRQSASPARAIQKKGPNNENLRSRRDLPKAPPKKENIPIPIPVRKVSEAPMAKANIPIPVRISPDPPSRPDAGTRPFRDRYQFEPLGDTLGRSNVVYPGTEAYRENLSDGQYYTKTLESFNSYFKNSSDTSQNYNNNSNNSHSYLQNSSYSQNSNDMQNNSSQGVSTNAAILSLNRKTSNTFDKTHQETSQQRRSSNAYSEQDERQYDHLNRNSVRRSSNAYSDQDENKSEHLSRSNRDSVRRSSYAHSEQDERKSDHLNRNNTDSVRRSSLTKGPQPLWLDANDQPQPGHSSGQNNIRRSSSASSKKSVSVIYIS